MKSYWDLLAEQFQHQKSPLRPCAEDIQKMEAVISAWQKSTGIASPQALIFGVTPEIVTMDWPPNTFLTSVEKSMPMIDRFWKNDPTNKKQVICGDWFQVLEEDVNYDIMVGDGFLTGLEFPALYNKVAELISRRLKPNGVFIARLFTSTHHHETVERIAEDLRNQLVPRFDVIKWRLAMALQPATSSGVVVGDIYKAWKSIEHHAAGMIGKDGWAVDTVRTIELYKDRTDRYAFPLPDEVIDALSPHLCIESVSTPSYALGECCPLFVFHKPVSPEID